MLRNVFRHRDLWGAVLHAHTHQKSVYRLRNDNVLIWKQEAQLITLWFGRRTKPRFVMSRLLLVKSVYQNTNC